MTMSASDAVTASAATESGLGDVERDAHHAGVVAGLGRPRRGVHLGRAPLQQLLHDGLAESALSAGNHDRRPLDVDHDPFSLT